MKKYFYTAIFSLTSLILLSTPIHAIEYTSTDVSSHNTPADCWVIFDNQVYEIPESELDRHADKFMDIYSWCGEDMTLDFKTKAGQGEDHKDSTYMDLSSYYIGDLATDTTISTSGPTTTTQDTKTETPTANSGSNIETKNPYNTWLPIILPLALYFGYWGLTKTELRHKSKFFTKNVFNLIFNTVLLLGLIPSALFGSIMANAYSFDFLKDINFDFLYWHVEFSIAWATLLIGHFLTRFTVYLAPLKLFRRRKNN